MTGAQAQSEQAGLPNVEDRDATLVLFSITRHRFRKRRIERRCLMGVDDRAIRMSCRIASAVAQPKLGPSRGTPVESR